MIDNNHRGTKQEFEELFYFVNNSFRKFLMYHDSLLKENSFNNYKIKVPKLLMNEINSRKGEIQLNQLKIQRLKELKENNDGSIDIPERAKGCLKVYYSEPESLLSSGSSSLWIYFYDKDFNYIGDKNPRTNEDYDYLIKDYLENEEFFNPFKDLESDIEIYN